MSYPITENLLLMIDEEIKVLSLVYGITSSEFTFKPDSSAT
jgi:hypothetical protein